MSMCPGPVCRSVLRWRNHFAVTAVLETDIKLSPQNLSRLAFAFHYLSVVA